MKKIKAGIFMESGYAGVTVGALLLERGTVLIDAPLKPEDGRSWLAALNKAGADSRRLLVNLDSHPDRTLGAQTLESQVMAQDQAVKQFRRRAAIFKALKQETGAEWENLTGLSGLRWVTPRVVYSDHGQIRMGDQEIVVEHHPGPSPGASWLLLPEAKVVFIGDLVAVKQAPFLSLADIDNWVDSIDLLRTKRFRGYKLVSGRSGIVKPKDLRDQRAFLRDVQARLRRIGKRKGDAKETEKLVPKLIEKYKYPAKDEKVNARRLKHGLHNYYLRHFTSKSDKN